MEYNPHAFADLNADNLRTYGLGITFAQQAEVLMRRRGEAGDGQARDRRLAALRVRPRAGRRFRHCRGGAEAGRAEAQDRLRARCITREIHTAPEAGIADLSLEIAAARPLPIVAKPQATRAATRRTFPHQGRTLVIGLVAATAGHAIFDCLQLEPAPRFSEAIEAEELAVVRATGGAAAPRPSEPIAGVSAGRVLEFHADKPGPGIRAQSRQAPGPALRAWGSAPCWAPQAAIVQAFVANKPIGPTFDLYAEERRLGPSVLPLGAVPAKASEVEIRVVAATSRREGHNAELDYLRWEPKILGPGTAEGVWVHVFGTHGCEYRPQDLGPTKFSDGHQFWVQPSELNAWVDIAVEIPKARSYEFVVKYTKSWDYARIQAFLDGKNLGPVVDTYAARVVPADPLTLGKVELSAGRHVLRFQAVGKHADSKGYLMGIDHVIVR